MDVMGGLKLLVLVSGMSVAAILVAVVFLCVAELLREHPIAMIAVVVVLLATVVFLVGAYS